MKEFLSILLSLLVTAAAREIHLVPAHKICPDAAGLQDILVPDPKDCSIYYRCANGAAIPQSCPTGLHWCQILQNCTLPAIANCTIGHTVVTYSPEELATYTQPTGMPETTGGTSFTNSNCGTDSSGNPGSCESSSSHDNTGSSTDTSGSSSNSGLPGSTPDESTDASDSSSGSDQPGGTTESSSSTSGSSGITGEITASSSSETSQKPPNILCSEPDLMYPSFSKCNEYQKCDSDRQLISVTCDPPTFNYNCHTKKCENTAHCCVPTGTTIKPSTSGSSSNPSQPGTTSGSSTDTSGSSSNSGLPGSTPGESTDASDSSSSSDQPGSTTESSSGTSGSSGITGEITSSSSSETSQKPPNILCSEPDLMYPSFSKCNEYQKCDSDRQLISVTCDPPTFNYNCHTKKCENTAHCCVPTGTTIKPSTSGSSSNPSQPGTTSGSSTDTSGPSSNPGQPGTTPGSSTDTSGPSSDPGQPGTTSGSSTDTSGSSSSPSQPGTTSGSSTDTSGPSSNPGQPGTTPGSSTDTSGPSSNPGQPGTTSGSSTDTSSLSSNPGQPGTTSGSSTDTSDLSSNPGQPGTTPGSSTDTSGPSSNPGQPGTTSGSSTDTSGPSSNPGQPGTTPGSSTDTSGPSSNPGQPGTTSGSYTDTSGPSSNPGQPGTTPGSSTDTSGPSSNPGQPGTTSGSSTDTSGLSSNPGQPGTTPGSSTDTSGPSSNPGQPGTTSGSSTDTSGLSSNPGQPGTTSGSSTDTSGLSSNPGQPGTTPGSSTDTSGPSSNPGQPGTTSGSSTDTSGPSSNPGQPGTTSGSSTDTSGSSSNPSQPGTTSGSSTDTSGPSSNPGQPGTTPGSSTDTSGPSSNPAQPGTTSGSSTDTSGSSSNPSQPGTTSGSSTDTSGPSSNPGQPGSTPGSSTGTSGSSGITDETTSSSSSETSHKPPNIFCSKPDLMYPSFSKCNEYQKCDSDRQLISVTCDPPTFNYNCHTKKCENTTHCCVPTVTTMKPSTPITPVEDVCPSDGAKLPNPIDCTAYFVCRNNTPVPQQCPKDQQYSCWDQVCENPKDKSCIMNTEQNDTCSNNGYILPNIGDCSRYYKCVNGKVESETCDSGKFFNEWFKECVPVSLSHCKTYPLNPGHSTSESPTTGITPGTNNICPIAGALLPNPLNCSTYYICKNEEPTLQSCPEGQIYSCWDQQCEASATADCITESHEGDSCAIDNLLLPKIEDCSSYYKCQNGSVVINKCPSDKKYNSWFHECVDSKFSHCHASTAPTTSSTTTESHNTVTPNEEKDVCPSDGAIIPNEVDCHSYYVCVNGTPMSQQCPNGEEYSCWDQKCERPENSVCINDASQEGNKCTIPKSKLPNTSDCSSYYECVDGKIKLQQCPKKEFYSKWFKGCRPDYLAHCKTYPTGKPPSTNQTPHSTVTPSPTNDICPFEGALLPNPLNCTTYFSCENHEPTLQNCPKGEGYSCWNQQCESDALDQCVPNSNSGQSCSVEGLILPKAGDCTKYYECKNGVVVTVKCPGGKGFNSWFHKCVDYEYSHCPYNSSSSSTTVSGTPATPVTGVTPPQTGACPIDGAKLPNPLDCNSYYVCKDGKIISKHCPAGKIYSCWNQDCENPTDGTCINQGNQQGQKCATNGVILPNIEDCGSYHECINGTVALKVCAEGSIFKEWLQACFSFELDFCITYPTVPLPPVTQPTPTPTPNPVYNVCPLEGSLLPNPLDCASYYKCINGTPTSEKCPGGMEYSCWDQECQPDTTATCVNQDLQNGDNCSIDGLKIADVASCDHYYECSNGVIILKKCPLGKEFNAAFQDCYTPLLSHCKTAPIVTATDSTNTEPSMTPSPNEELCPNDGALLPNPLNCSAYYKCINGTPTPQLCADGFEYSCWNEECEPASQSQCISEGNQTGVACKYDGQRIQNAENCHTYYQCVNGKAKLQTCFLNWYYNKWFHFCTPLEILSHCKPITIPTPRPTQSPPPTKGPQKDENVCPVDGALLPDPLDCSGYYKCKNDKPVHQKCPSGQEYSCWDQECKQASNAECVNKGLQPGQKCSRDGVRLPNLDNCASYYECSDGIAEPRFCFFGFQYNQWFQECVLTPFAHCKTYPSSTSASTSTETIISTPSSSYDVCPVDGAKIPNAVDCTKYYKCEHNTLTIQSCPAGEEYSCWDQKCELDLNSNCISQSQVGAKCSVDGLKLSQITNCSNYLECVNGSVVEKQCENGLEFNDRFQSCYKPSYSYCKPHSTITPHTGKPSTPSPAPGTDACPTDGALLPNPVNCSSYFKCINGSSVPQQCAEGYEYSCWDQKCEPAGEAQCISSKPTKCSNNGEKMPDPQNCQQYLQCVDHKIVHKKCPFDLYYNKWFEICVIKLIAHCEKTPVTKPTTQIPTTTPKPSSSFENCPRNGDKIPDPTDCSKYLECSDHRPVTKSCPEGQKYSAWDQGCKPAAQVDCYNIGSPLGKSCSRDGVTLQNLESCTSYYSCNSGTVEENYCFIGFRYNKWYQRCELALFSHCNTYSTVAAPSTTTIASPVTSVGYPRSSCDKNNAKVADVNDCNKYYVCQDGSPVHYNCPPGTNYDVWDEKCASNAECVKGIKDENRSKCDKHTTVPDPNSCSSYYECNGHRIKKKNCSFLKQYDVWDGKCRLNILATCYDEITE